MTSDLAAWLEAQGLGQYAKVLAENEVDLEALRLVSEHDLQALGIPLGPRKKLLKAIENSGSAVTITPPRSPDSYTPTHLSKKIPTSKSAPEGERRQLTVLFCDMVGFTELANRVDPEILQGIIRSYEDACAVCITRYEGYVFQLLGDGIVAFFGYPLAHEGEAERAIHAGLAIIEALSKLDVPDAGHLAVRIGIATGLVVVSSAEKGAVGETMNLASRLQAVAQPGSIVVSERVHRLAGGSFNYQDLGEQTLKGITQPTHAYRIVGVSEAASRFEAATQEGVTPLVGREQEIGLLMERWALAQDGEGQVVLLSGEPGIGKSRILSALRERLEAQGAQTLRFQCSPYYANSAFWPSIDNFERALRFGRDEPPESKLDKLEALMVTYYGRPLADVRFVASMLSVPCEARYGAIAMSPQKHKDETLRSLVDLTEAATRKQSSVMLFEDVHWADPTSLEVLDQLVDRLRTIPLLIVLTHRPEFQSRWPQHGHVTGLNLSKLTRAQSAAMVSRLAGGKALPADLLEQILAKTDGVPLFVEELTKVILESNLVEDQGGRYELAGPLPTLAIPNSLRDSLMARLDRLGQVKEVAQIGACIGREFSDELLVSVSPLPRMQLAKALKQLTASELVFKRGSGKDTAYVFKHALVQDAAYDSLLKSKRAEVHAKIADVLERHFPETAQSEPELLATHLTAAARAEAAISYWLKAGERSLERAAMREAISHFQNGMALLENVRDPDKRQSLEIDLRVALAMAWTLVKGFAADELFDTLMRAWGILEESGTRRHAARVLWGIWAHQLSCGKIEASLKWVRRMLEEAEQDRDETLWFVGQWSAAIVYYWHGDFESCSHHADLILERYVPARHGPIPEMMNYDALTVALLHRAFCEARTGFYARALRSIEEARAHAARLNAPVNTAYVHWQAAWNHLARWDGERTMQDLDALEVLARRHGLYFFEAVLIPLLRAQALCVLGDYEGCVRDFDAARSVWKSVGMQISVPEAAMHFALALGRLGRVDEALSEVEGALEQIARPDWHERYALSELLRVKGWLLERRGAQEAAELAYRESLETARAQRARTHELRTATSYAHLLRSQRRAREARDLLQPIYAWFTEGFETRDLTEAKALLDELHT